MFKSGKPVHPSNALGSAPNAATTPGGVVVSFDIGPNRNRQTTLGVIISNLEVAAGNSLEVSFSKGHFWFAIPPATTVTIPAVIHEIYLRGATGAVSLYSVMGIV